MGFLQPKTPNQLMAEQEGLIESAGPQAVDVKRDRDHGIEPGFGGFLGED